MRPLVSLSRPVLLMIAVAFAAVATFYSFIWMVSIRRSVVDAGIAFHYSAAKRGMLITAVASDSSAQKAGLRPGDHVLAVNGHRLDDLVPYYDFVVLGHRNDRVQLSVLRSGVAEPLSLQMVLKPFVPMEFMGRIKTLILEVLGFFPVFYLVVGFAVLFLRLNDDHAWLLALLFAAFIGSAPLFEAGVPSALRGFVVFYRVGFGGLEAALFYYFFATFPASSPVDRHVPWLKGVTLAITVLVVAPLALWCLLSGGLWPIWRHPGWFFTSATESALFAYAIFFNSLGLLSMISNVVGATQPDARRKARVLVWGVVAGVGPVVILNVAMSFSTQGIYWLPFWSWAIAILCLFLILPLSFAYAVVKHRVLDVPLLFKRSARYLLVQRGFVFLTLLVGIAATLGFAALLARLLQSEPGTPLALELGAGAAFGVLLAWTGSRAVRGITQRIDRAFFRSAYDARRILENLAVETRQTTERRKLAGLLAGEISQGLHPMSLAVYFEGRDGLLRVERDSTPPRFPPLSPESKLLRELARRGEPWELANEKPGVTDALSGVAEFGSAPPECMVPILGREGRLLGVIALGPRLSEEPYSREDLRLLASVGSQAAVVLENIRLAQEIAERLEAERRAAHEIEIAREVQSRLFPQKQPALSTLDYAGACIQARQVGGDYYDFLDLGLGRLGLVIADIAGKGISAALLMANLQANLRSQYALALSDPVRLLESVNRLFQQNTADTSYATLVFADYDDKTRRLRYINCGHLALLLARADGRVEWLRATATVLGMFEDWGCAAGERTLEPGDLLLLYSDGATEAASDEGEEFGESRLVNALMAQAHLPVPDLLGALVANIQEFSGREQEDDLTLVVARAK
jgi:phosphoserine phosphatase RsbU/P